MLIAQVLRLVSGVEVRLNNRCDKYTTDEVQNDDSFSTSSVLILFKTGFKTRFKKVMNAKMRLLPYTI